MLYLTICDDENTQLSLLKSYVAEWAGERRHETDITLCKILQVLYSEKEAKWVALLPVRPFTLKKAAKIRKKQQLLQ